MTDQIDQFDANSDDAKLPRNHVFVLADGTFVVGWNLTRVQDLETGHYRSYSPEDFGAAITDYELKQLKNVGLVEDYNDEFVWLYALPERHHKASLISDWEANRVRSYYLNTKLPGATLGDIVDLLEDLELSTQFHPRIRDNFVVIWGDKGKAFPRFDDVEKARTLLISKSPEAFSNTIVAFIETSKKLVS